MAAPVLHKEHDGFRKAALRRFLLASSFLILAANAAAAADAVSAEAPPAPQMQDQARWRVIFSPYVWGASLTGSAGLFGRSTDVDVPFHDIFRHLDMSAMGNIEVTNGTFGAYFDGQYTKTSQDENIRAHELGLDITSTTLAGGVFYRVYEKPLEGTTLFGNQRVFAIEPTAGLRWTQLKAGLSVGPFSRTEKAEWTDPFVGTRLLYDISDRWNLAAEADVGGFGAGTWLSANGQIYLGYRTYVLNVPTIFRVGYRALYQDYRDDDAFSRFNWKVTQHGPVVGFSIVF